MSASLLPRRALVRFALAAVLAAAGLVAPAVVAAATPTAVPAGLHTVGGVSLGPSVYVFTPQMTQQHIQNTVDAIAAEQVGNQFGTQRYALLFEPGTYGTTDNPLIFQVGYYTEVAGLGQSPDDTTINGTIDVYNQCEQSNDCTALDNFWRSLSNLHINVAGGSGCQANTEFWAVSQAAPMRRVDVTGATSFMDYCTAPSYASGGFVADSNLGGNVVNGSQQQFLVRNSSLGGWSNGVWNQVFVGDDGAPAESFPSGNQYTTVASTPDEQEEPYLYLDGNGDLDVFVPSEQTDTAGPTWTTNPTAGTSLPASGFRIVRQGTSAADIDAALAKGKNLIVVPGVFQLDKPLRVTHSGAIVLGLGMATLTPTTGTAAMVVSGVGGVEISGLIFDANLSASPYLLKLMASGTATPPADLLQDVFFRVGGAQAGRVGTAAVVDASHVLLDDVWAWRADHGAGVGWTDNTADHGVAVNGSDVTAYGLFVEHFQKADALWNGSDGSVYFLQNEMPYDVPSQSAWMMNNRIEGYPALRVTASGSGFRGYGMGSYCYFDQGLDIHATEGFDFVPGTNERVHDVLTVFLNGSGGIDSVVNGIGAPVDQANASTPSDVVG